MAGSGKSGCAPSAGGSVVGVPGSGAGPGSGSGPTRDGTTGTCSSSTFPCRSRTESTSTGSASNPWAAMLA